MYQLTRLFSRLPLALLYRFADVFYFLAYYILRYRRDVARSNLNRAFPDKTPRERAQIERLTYRNLADVLVESLKLRTLPEAELRRRVSLTNTEDLGWQQQPVMIITAHQCNWEWLLQRIIVECPQQVYGVYKPLHSHDADRFMRETRQRFGGQAVPYKEFGRSALRRRGQSCVMVADQSPPSERSALWLDFFNQRTAFFAGPARLSAHLAMPVFYAAIRRTHRGMYEVRFTELGCAEPSHEESFIAGYVAALERSIQAQPESWLWTHRRWKLSDRT